MKPQTKQFERQFIRRRDAIERKGISIYKRALAEQYNYVLSRLRSTDFRQWVELVDSIPEKPIEDAFYRFYPMNAPLGTMEYLHLKQGKATDEEKKLNSVFSLKLTNIVRTKCGDKIKTITSTSKDKIKQIIRDVIDQGETEGIGIPEMTSRLFKTVGQNLRGNGYARAKAIAQTEVISASNQASEYAAYSTGYAYKKFWSTSGLPNIRETHIEAEQYSDSVGGLLPDETFPNGLLYPGDPAGDVYELVNCRSTLIHELI